MNDKVYKATRVKLLEFVLVPLYEAKNMVSYEESVFQFKT